MHPKKGRVPRRRVPRRCTTSRVCESIERPTFELILQEERVFTNDRTYTLDRYKLLPSPCTRSEQQQERGASVGIWTTWNGSKHL